MLTIALVIGGLILVNALYVAAEFAAVKVRRAPIRRLAEQGHRSAAILAPELESASRLDRYVAACQIGITFSSLVLGAYGQAALAPRIRSLLARFGADDPVAAETTAALIVLVGLTALQMVIGELVPKSLALQFPQRTALATAIPMRWSLRLLAGFIRLLNGSGQWILERLGVHASEHRHIHSPEEISLLLAQDAELGSIDDSRQRLVRRALEMRSRTARHVMTPIHDVVTVDTAWPAEQLLDFVESSPFTRLPAQRGTRDEIVGILHIKDLVEHVVETGGLASLEEVLRPPLEVHEHATLERVLDAFRSRREQLALVIDEYGAIVGLVTASDLLSEVLGDLPDEFKPGRAVPQRLPDGRIRLPGRTSLDRAARWTGVAWDGESETVAGLVMELTGAMPQVGQTVEIDGLQIEVETVSGLAVTSVLVSGVAPGREGTSE